MLLYIANPFRNAVNKAEKREFPVSWKFREISKYLNLLTFFKKSWKTLGEKNDAKFIVS